MNFGTARWVSVLLAAALGCTLAPESGTRTPQQATDVEEIRRLEAFFERSFARELERSPEFQTALGIKEDYDRWDDRSDTKALEDRSIAAQELAELHSFDPAALDEGSRLSWRLFEYRAERVLERFPWRFHTYPVNQMFGLQADVPAFLINFHRIDTEQDARDYIARLHGIRPLFAELERGLAAREELGIIPPRFVFPYVLDDCRNVLNGAPFAASEADSTLLADFRKKVDAITLSEERRGTLMAGAESALLEAVEPAYLSLIEALLKLEARATTDDGVWKFRDGDRFYDYRLAEITTTDLDAESIHEMGLREVARIHGEMRDIAAAVDFEGSLEEFFFFLREEARFYDPDTPEGRDTYMARVRDTLEAMQARLPTAFVTLPHADLVAKPVEPFREKSAGKAFYSGPAPDGSRPGIFYANLYRMRDMPIFEAESLVYHEGVPGHHLQIAIATERADIPRFRRFSGYTAFIEGWGLYAERLAKEMGFYRDPYSDFGRLSLELWRACRLVVDTGLHRLRWTRERAIDYLLENTSASRGQAQKAIERYIVMPAQATAYKVGMNVLLELRENARRRIEARDEDFDLREFHDLVLRGGALPLSILRELVDTWASRRHALNPEASERFETSPGRRRGGSKSTAQ